MAAFPKLRTGAIAQYPLVNEVEYRVQVVTFLDGSEQRLPASGKCGRRWVVELSGLSSAEAALLREFFLQQHGRAGVFEFTDPVSGEMHARCCFEQDEIVVRGADRGSVWTRLVIRALEE
jgi:hypothetical protein